MANARNVTVRTFVTPGLQSASHTGLQVNNVDSSHNWQDPQAFLPTPPWLNINSVSGFM
jgi:hypothetical protein